MPSTEPILPDDRQMVELASKKLGGLILDTLGLGVSASRFGLPKPHDFFVKRQTQLQALAVTLRCVTVSPNSEANLVSSIHGSSERLVGLLEEWFQDLLALCDWESQPGFRVENTIRTLSQHTRLLVEGINAHLRLVGSGAILDAELVSRCETILSALPAEFGAAKVGGPA